jgi:hypothetical protein
MNAVFVNIGYLLALEIANNQIHRAVVEHWQQIATALPLLETTSYVFDEVVTFFNSQAIMQRRPKLATTSCIVHLYSLSTLTRRYSSKAGCTSGGIR